MNNGQYINELFCVFLEVFWQISPNEERYSDEETLNNEGRPRR